MKIWRVREKERRSEEREGREMGGREREVGESCTPTLHSWHGRQNTKQCLQLPLCEEYDGVQR